MRRSEIPELRNGVFAMKKEYTYAEIEIIRLAPEDPIVTSGGGSDPQQDPYKKYDIDDLPIAP